MSNSRRNFIKWAGMATGAGVLSSGCASLDRWVLGESRDEDQTVVILGAGIAGVYSAHLLRQAKIPFRIYEAQGRIGGRILGLTGVGDLKQQNIELGAELLTAADQNALRLCREFRIPLEKYSGVPGFYVKGVRQSDSRVVSAIQSLNRMFQRIYQESMSQTSRLLLASNRDQFPRAIELDEITALELLTRIRTQLSELQRELCEQWTYYRFGVGPQSISALSWLENTRVGFSTDWYRLPGGMSLLPQAIFDRTAGVVPERFARFNHRLTGIDQKSERFHLTFLASGREIEIKTRNVICTIPPVVFSQIKGAKSLALTESMHKLLSTATSASISRIVGFQSEQYWRREKDGICLQAFERDVFTVHQPWEVNPLSRPHNAVSFTYAGPRGLTAGPHLSDTSRLLMLNHMRNKSQIFSNDWRVQNWSRLPLFKGAKSYFAPGMLALREEYMGFENESLKWLFAGEASNLSQQGSIEAALLSAQTTVERIVKQLK